MTVIYASKISKLSTAFSTVEHMENVMPKCDTDVPSLQQVKSHNMHQDICKFIL